MLSFLGEGRDAEATPMGLFLEMQSNSPVAVINVLTNYTRQKTQHLEITTLKLNSLVVLKD